MNVSKAITITRALAHELATHIIDDGSLLPTGTMYNSAGDVMFTIDDGDIEALGKLITLAELLNSKKEEAMRRLANELMTINPDNRR